MMLAGVVRAALLSLVLASLMGPRVAHAAGPWRGQVLDAETGQPLAGVVVVAVWERLSPGMVHQARAFHDVDELVTGADGRFVIPARTLQPLNPFVSIEGPKLTMFKGGYGKWLFREARNWPADIGLRGLAWDKAMAQFAQDGQTFELRRLRTDKERREDDVLSLPAGGVPHHRIPRLIDAIDDELIFLGLTPLYRKRS